MLANFVSRRCASPLPDTEIIPAQHVGIPARRQEPITISLQVRGRTRKLSRAGWGGCGGGRGEGKGGGGRFLDSPLLHLPPFHPHTIQLRPKKKGAALPLDGSAAGACVSPRQSFFFPPQSPGQSLGAAAAEEEGK